jgi:hypothetical protein
MWKTVNTSHINECPWQTCDLPVQLPTKCPWIINLKTEKALGLKIRPHC